jgi:hypothetical protein
VIRESLLPTESDMGCAIREADQAAAAAGTTEAEGGALDPALEQLVELFSVVVSPEGLVVRDDDDVGEPQGAVSDEVVGSSEVPVTAADVGERSEPQPGDSEDADVPALWRVVGSSSGERVQGRPDGVTMETVDASADVERTRRAPSTADELPRAEPGSEGYTELPTQGQMRNSNSGDLVRGHFQGVATGFAENASEATQSTPSDRDLGAVTALQSIFWQYVTRQRDEISSRSVREVTQRFSLDFTEPATRELQPAIERQDESETGDLAAVGTGSNERTPNRNSAPSADTSVTRDTPTTALPAGTALSDGFSLEDIRCAEEISRRLADVEQKRRRLDFSDLQRPKDKVLFLGRIPGMALDDSQATQECIICFGELREKDCTRLPCCLKYIHSECLTKCFESSEGPRERAKCPFDRQVLSFCSEAEYNAAFCPAR